MLVHPDGPSPGLTVTLVRPLRVAVHRAGGPMSGPASVGNAKMNVKLHIHVEVLLFCKTHADKTQLNDKAKTFELKTNSK